MSSQDHADVIREQVSHIARGCRSGLSHNPAPYEAEIAAALDALVARAGAAEAQVEVSNLIALDYRREREAAEKDVARLNHENGALEAEGRTLREALSRISSVKCSAGCGDFARAALAAEETTT